jgi:hypothetical protein
LECEETQHAGAALVKELKAKYGEGVSVLIT